MSFFRAVVIECDGEGCDHQYEGGDLFHWSAHEARRAASGLGWSYSRTWPSDLCPDCTLDYSEETP